MLFREDEQVGLLILGKLDPLSELICELKVVDSRFDVPINYLIKRCATPGAQNVFLGFGSVFRALCRTLQ